MNDLRELYQEVIIDHGRRPRNFHALEDSSMHAEGFNPLCGDKIDLYLKIDNDVIQEVAFTGEGCAISTASASLMTQVLQGKTVSQARSLFTDFHELLTKDGTNKDLGKLMILAGVREFPIRVKCATLAWHTLQAALDGKQSTCTE